MCSTFCHVKVRPALRSTLRTGALPKSMPPMPPPPKRSQLSQKAPEVGELEAASEEVSDCWSWKLMVDFFGYQQDWKDSLRNVFI